MQIINDNRILKLSAISNLGVDAFIVLSGFLAVFSMKSRICSFSFRRYIWRRCHKIMIPYILALLMTYFTIPHGDSIPGHMKSNHNVMFAYCPQTLPLSLLLLNNFVGFGGCSLHLWSVSAQMQLFVLYGVVLKVLSSTSSNKLMSSLTAFAWIAFALCTVARVLVGLIYNIEMPVPAFDHPYLDKKSKDDAFRFYHTMYFLTPLRLCNFTAGILLAVFVRATQRYNTPRIRWSIIAIACIVIQMYYKLAVSIEYEQIPSSAWALSPAWASLVFHGSPGASLLFSSVLYCCLAPVKHQNSQIDFKIYRIVKYLSEVRKVVPVYIDTSFTRISPSSQKQNHIYMANAGIILDLHPPPIHPLLGSMYYILL